MIARLAFCALLAVVACARVEADPARGKAEAFSDTAATTSTTKEEATFGKWRQYLRISKVGATEYVDEGNGNAASD